MANFTCELYSVESLSHGKVYTLNSVITDYVNSYFALPVAGKKVVTPYYINVKKRKDLNALVGKGTPEEIVLETKVWAQTKHVNLKRLTAEQIREFMLNVGIGIDCSGLVALSLDEYFRKCKRSSFFRAVKYQDQSVKGRLARFFRPATNLSANEMTSNLNASGIGLNSVRPGDVIKGVGKQRNAYHIVLIEKVVTKAVKSRENKKEETFTEIVSEIHYVHSHRGYGAGNGMRRGLVKVTDITQPWWKQDWEDFGEDGRNDLLEDDLLPFKAESGFRRLKILQGSES